MRCIDLSCMLYYDAAKKLKLYWYCIKMIMEYIRQLRRSHCAHPSDDCEATGPKWPLLSACIVQAGLSTSETWCRISELQS